MKNPLIIIIGIVIILGGLLYWSSSFQSGAQTTFVEGTNVACLPNGHQQLALHVHPTLAITVDGEPEPVPANIGITGNCMAEVHTHDASGTVHVETATAERFSKLSFADLFAVWGQPVEREGYDLVITVDGQEVSSINEVPLKDHSSVELVYVTKS